MRGIRLSMPHQVKMRDMVIVLPGIAGSVLQKDGKDVWAPSSQAAWRMISSGAGSLRGLQLGTDDPTLEDLGDGIRATRIVVGPHILPRLEKAVGYSRLRQMLQSEFQMTPGSIDVDGLVRTKRNDSSEEFVRLAAALG